MWQQIQRIEIIHTIDSSSVNSEHMVSLFKSCSCPKLSVIWFRVCDRQIYIGNYTTYFHKLVLSKMIVVCCIVWYVMVRWNYITFDKHSRTTAKRVLEVLWELFVLPYNFSLHPEKTNRKKYKITILSI